jgi:uncharacterized membrane protein
MNNYLQKDKMRGLKLVRMKVDRRALTKTLTWRFIATGTTILVAFLFTGSLVISLEIGSLEMILKLVFYYLHERIWDRTDLRKEVNSQV